jgi:PEP-CTERM motif
LTTVPEPASTLLLGGGLLGLAAWSGGGMRKDFSDSTEITQKKVSPKGVFEGISKPFT